MAARKASEVRLACGHVVVLPFRNSVYRPLLQLGVMALCPTCKRWATLDM